MHQGRYSVPSLAIILGSNKCEEKKIEMALLSPLRSRVEDVVLCVELPPDKKLGSVNINI